MAQKEINNVFINYSTTKTEAEICNSFCNDIGDLTLRSIQKRQFLCRAQWLRIPKAAARQHDLYVFFFKS